MATLFRHIIAYFSVALLVGATGGIGLVQHYCSCEDDAHVMVATSSLVPFQKGEADACCQTEHRDSDGSCCAASAQQKKDRTDPQCQAGKGCCSEQYSFFKTDQFNLSGTPATHLQYSPVVVAELQDSRVEEAVVTNLLTQVSDRSPPGIFGRVLLIRIHQLKTEPLIS